MFLTIAFLFLLIILLSSSFFTIKQQTMGIIERFGKFHRIVKPGLNIKVPFIDQLVAKVNLRVQQLDVEVETKTEDNVFVKIRVSVQYMVIHEKVFDAYYKLSNVQQQITSFVFDVVRAQVPHLKLDDVFAKKDDIAIAVKEELQVTMEEFGYQILKALVTDVDPDKNVKHAMNEINTATRLKMAAIERGETEKILKVKAAEAEAESKALQGKGIALQRKAIIDGLKESVEDFRHAVDGATAKDVMMLVLMTQYFDTLKEIAENSSTNTIMVPSTPGGLSSFTDQIREALISAIETSKVHADATANATAETEILPNREKPIS
ncbi:MAG: SPFH domain-containing protein [Bacteroidia bacterium]|nr:SPFH domain-containing protein [Bacteroidia bacterium]MDW8157848.1 SPFH domain-containing protein [Bacteroidia bacterium]